MRSRYPMRNLAGGFRSSAAAEAYVLFVAEAASAPKLNVTGTLVEQKGLFFRQDLPNNHASV